MPTSALPNPGDAQSHRERLRAARSCIQGFEAATRRHGSVLQALIRGQPIEAYTHYPDNDVRDESSGSQYFYHSHRCGPNEHGHLHLFWHADSRARRIRRRGAGARSAWAPTHLLAIGIDQRGLPVSLFTTNWWVTDGYWFDAPTTLDLVDRFSLAPRGRYGSVNRFIDGLLSMYRPLIVRLLRERDRRVARLTRRRPWESVRVDERHEVLSYLSIDWLADIEALESAGASERSGRRLA